MTGLPTPEFHDPRAKGFRDRTTVDDVLALIDGRIGPPPGCLTPLAGAGGLVLAEPVVAGVDLPGFDRAAMDGFALRGEETYGADAYAPAVFRVVGRSRPGLNFDGRVGPGEAVEIATGAPLPDGADTVVPVEATRPDGPDRVAVNEPVAVGRHVGRRGEDVTRGTAVFSAGRVLRPQDLGVLSGLGHGHVLAYPRPKVTILVTGDEILAAGSAPDGPRFADMNSPMLEALVSRDGGVPRTVGPIPDRRELLLSLLAAEAASADALIVSGGTSTGPEDHAPGVVRELGELAVHGVALRPASPTGLGFVGKTPVILLPGNPVSCLCGYDLFAGRVVRRLGGRPPGWAYRPVDRPLAHKLVSALGRVDYARVRVTDGMVEPLATGRASALSTTTRADGFVLVPAGLEGYPAGASVTVWLYDEVGSG